MLIKIMGRLSTTLLLAVVFFATACGTLEVGLEPESLPAATRTTATQRVEAEAEAPAETTQGPALEPTPEPAATEPQIMATEPVEVEAHLPSEVATLDDTWSKYTNYQMGFSINFPITMVHIFGSCTWSEAEESYRPELTYVPVEIFEDENTVYISSAYYHELSGEIKQTDAEGGTRIFYTDCSAVENNLQLLAEPENHYQMKWEMVAVEVYDDQEIDTFIKERYGAGCSLGEKIASGQEGVYDLTIQGDGLDLSQSLCPINYRTVIKYYPEGNKIIAWDTGQAGTFAADPSYTVTHDQEMIDSFRFLVES